MVLLFFMDGVKYDMMRQYMPFLASLNVRPLQSEFGYSCACHATMYTSRYIEEHGTWFIWKRGNHSPYKWLDYVPGLKYINFLPLKLLIGKITRVMSKNSSYSGVSCLVNLPLKYWSLFEPCDDVMWTDVNWKKNLPNLFTIMQKNEIRMRTVALHRGTKADDAFVEERSVDYQNDEIAYFFIGYTDNIMHKYGENGCESQEYLTKVDQFIESTFRKAKEFHDDVTVIAYSDHGHIDLKEPYIDIETYFRERGLRVNHYIHLIESNYARFWFRNGNEQIEVKKVLTDMQNEGLGYIIDDTHRQKYHLNLNPAEHGELVFYLAAPSEFTNTIWGFGHSVKSGHGFEPTEPKHYGMFCTDRYIREECEVVYLTDILPTVIKCMGIDPDGYLMRGHNVIK